MASFMKSLERLSYAGFKIVNKSGEENEKFQDVKDVYEGYMKDFEKIRKELDNFQRSIDYKERKLDRIDYYIDRNKRIMERMKDEKGLGVRFSVRYKNRKAQIKYLEKQKKLIPKQLKLEYKEMKRKQKKLKEAQKVYKKFEKAVKKMAKQKAKEIKFITYYKEHKYILEDVYNKQEIEKIEKYIKQLTRKENGDKVLDPKECLKEIKKAVKSQSRKIFKAKFEKEKSIFKVKEREEAENTEKDVDDERYSRTKKFKQKSLQVALSKSTIFVNSNFKREALEYAFKESGYKKAGFYSPEQVVLAIGIADDMHCTVDQSLEAIEKGEVPDEVIFKTDSYIKKGMNMIEMMKDKNPEKMTRTEKIAKNISNLYEKYYVDWQEKNVRKIDSKQQGRDIN